MLLEGRRTLITGASSGIGTATALRFGAEGASVCVNYYSDQEKADAEVVCTQIDGSTLVVDGGMSTYPKFI